MSRLRTFIALGRAQVVPRVLHGVPGGQPAPRPRDFFTLDGPRRDPVLLFAISGGIFGTCLELAQHTGLHQLLFASVGQLVLIGVILGALIGTILYELSEKYPIAARGIVLLGVILLLMSIGAELGWIVGNLGMHARGQVKQLSLEYLTTGAITGLTLGLLLALLLVLRLRSQRSAEPAEEPQATF